MKTKYYDYAKKRKKPELDGENESAVVKETAKPAAETPIVKELREKTEKLVARPGKVIALSNMRQGPSLDSNILCVLAVGQSISVLGDAGDFYKIKFNGIDGYLKKDLCEV